VTVVYLALAALVVLGVVMVLTGRWDPGIAPADRPPPPPLPPGPWRPADVEELRFRVGLRGYRMQDVDAALSALATELRRRDAEVSRETQQRASGEMLEPGPDQATWSPPAPFRTPPGPAPDQVTRQPPGPSGTASAG
jgi:DivIVA domain-containing protein